MPTPELLLDRIERRIPPRPKAPPEAPEVPNIIDFVVEERYLNRPKLYLRQATMLKVIFLADDLFTDYDLEVLGEYGAGRERGLEHNKMFGVPTDLFERIAHNKAVGRRAFREILMVGGRRGGKGYLGALAASYVLWNFLATGNPQEHFGIAPGKTLTIPVFAQNKDQARDVFWLDLKDVISNAPCFKPFIADQRVDRLALWSPHQLGSREGDRGDPAFEIVAREATESAARGYASPILVHDEMAHDVSTGSARGAEEIYPITAPQLAQFGLDAFSYFPSSPRQRTGMFYELYERALAFDQDGNALHPEMLAIQFPSWELYRDWEEERPLYPGGPFSAPIKRPIISEDHPDIERMRVADPATYRVEYLAHWAEVSLAFFIRDYVLAIAEPFNGRVLEVQEKGVRSRRYFCHVDLSARRDNTGLVIAHPEGEDDPASLEVVVDRVEYWEPRQFADGEIHMRTLGTIFGHRLDAFPTMELWTFDSFNSLGFMQDLRDHAHERRLHTRVEEFSPGRQEGRDLAEQLRVLIHEGRLHAPFNQLLIDELLYLQDLGDRVDHPATGPVITNDIYTCLVGVVAGIIKSARDPGRRLSEVGLRASQWPVTQADQQIFDRLGASRRPSGVNYQTLREGKTTREYRRRRRF